VYGLVLGLMFSNGKNKTSIWDLAAIIKRLSDHFG
jgi:hypothetical protein